MFGPQTTVPSLKTVHGLGRKLPPPCLVLKAGPPFEGLLSEWWRSAFLGRKRAKQPGGRPK